jgi:hypothetical protein
MFLPDQKGNDEHQQVWDQGFHVTRMKKVDFISTHWLELHLPGSDG